MNEGWMTFYLASAVWLGAALASSLLMVLMDLPELVFRRSARRLSSTSLSMVMSILLLAAMTYYLLPPAAPPIWEA